MTPEQKQIWAAVYGATWSRLNREFDRDPDPPENQEAANVITAAIYATNAIMDLAVHLDDVADAAGLGSAVDVMAKEMGSDPGFEKAEKIARGSGQWKCEECFTTYTSEPEQCRICGSDEIVPAQYARSVCGGSRGR